MNGKLNCKFKRFWTGSKIFIWVRDESPTKKKRVNYWGAETEAAIIEFNQTQEQEGRDRIYAEKLHAPFCKLVENIVNRFKFPYIGESYESIHNDALGQLVKNIHQFDPSKGKSFSYASIVVKNHLIIRNNACYKRHNREVPIIEYDDPEYEAALHDGQAVTLSYSAPDYDVKEFLRLLVEWWQVNISKVFDYEYERVIAKAVLQTMVDIPDIHGRGCTGKNQVYKVLRTITGKSSQQVGNVVSIMAARYRILVKKYHEKGYLLEKPVKPKPNRKKITRNVGSRNRQSKLTEDQAVEIRRLYAAGSYTQREIGRLFGVNDSVVSTIVRGRGWKHTLPEGFTSAHNYRWRGGNKLTEAQVSRMRRQSQDGITDTDLAAMYGVTDRSIRKIRRGDSWKHLLPPSPIVLASYDTDQSVSQSLLVSA